MNNFEYYVGEGKVKKSSPDMELSISLIKDADSRFEKVTKLDIEEFGKIIFENIYDALRDLLDAVLAFDGFKSYSHEAAIAYMEKYGFEDSVLQEMDHFRYLRNSSKYYGKDIPASDIEGIIEFYKKYSEKIKRCAKK